MKRGGESDDGGLIEGGGNGHGRPGPPWRLGEGAGCFSGLFLVVTFWILGLCTYQ